PPASSHPHYHPTRRSSDLASDCHSTDIARHLPLRLEPREDRRDQGVVANVGQGRGNRGAGDGRVPRPRGVEPTHGAEYAVLEVRSEEHTSELQSLAYLVCR